MFYTKRGGFVYAFAMGWPANNVLVLTQPVTTGNTTVTMLGCSKPMAWAHGVSRDNTKMAAGASPLPPPSSAAAAAAAAAANGLTITVPPLMPTELPSYEGPWVFKIGGVI